MGGRLKEIGDKIDGGGGQRLMAVEGYVRGRLAEI